jgi:hypothetical protein
MTLPARAEATATPCSVSFAGAKNERLHDEVTSSVAPLLIEYGSKPPIASSSR